MSTHWRNRYVVLGAAALHFVLGSGCAPTRNEPLETFSPTYGYRFDNLERGDKNTDDLFVVLTFSGGGTRAAALSYGVLQGLREIKIPADGAGPERTLLDEIDMISSVSGGSFTAATYGLWREDIFDGRFEENFLQRDVQGDLLLGRLNPLNLPLTTSEIAAPYHDAHVFNHHTYQDLIDRGTRPFIIINSTDVSRQERMQFTQQFFDLLGSDLSRLPIAWAVASSSAYPVLLGPLRYKYFPGQAHSAAVEHELKRPHSAMHSITQRWAESLLQGNVYDEDRSIEVDARNHKYLYVLDGGLVDNLGLHAFIDSWYEGGIRKRIDQGKIKQLVIIIVDASTKTDNDVEKRMAPPGTFGEVATTATTGLNTGTMVSKTVVHFVFLEVQPIIRRCQLECNLFADAPEDAGLVTYVADINMQGVEDKQLRNELMAVPTTFALDDAQVDLVIQAGKDLVRQNDQILSLQQEFGGT